VVRTRERRDTFRVSVEIPEGKKPLGRPRRRWEDDIETDLQAFGWGVDYIDLAQSRDTSRAMIIEVMTIRVP
jgi:hypothetical protein